jgi:hypothetical protein
MGQSVLWQATDLKAAVRSLANVRDLLFHWVRAYSESPSRLPFNDHCRLFLQGYADLKLTTRRREDWGGGGYSRPPPFFFMAKCLIKWAQGQLLPLGLPLCRSEGLLRGRRIFSKFVRSGVFKAATMKIAVFWNVTPCVSCKNRHFGGT